MPSTVRVKSGQPVEVRGGYYPIDYDVRASARAEPRVPMRRGFWGSGIWVM